MVQRILLICLLLLSALPAQAQLRGHGGPVRALALSSDGETAVSGSFDTSAIIWSLKTNTARQVLRFHDGAVNAVALLPDGGIATASADARIALWHAGETQPRTVLEGHAAPIVALAVSPDGKTLASASWDRTVRLWPLAGGAPRVLEGHQQNVNGVAFLPDGALVSAGYDATRRRSSSLCLRRSTRPLSCRTARSCAPAPTAKSMFCHSKANCAPPSRSVRHRSLRSPCRPTLRLLPPPASAARWP